MSYSFVMINRVFFLGHWSLFLGGAVDLGESPMQAIVREIHEEIGLEFEEMAFREYATFKFDLSPVGKTEVYRKYYELELISSAI